MLRRVWAPRGLRPIATGHHRFEWLYVTAFVSPATGESFWYLGTGVDKTMFEETLALFAREAGAGRDRIILVRRENDSLDRFLARLTARRCRMAQRSPRRA